MNYIFIDPKNKKLMFRDSITSPYDRIVFEYEKLEEYSETRRYFFTLKPNKLDIAKFVFSMDNTTIAYLKD